MKNKSIEVQNQPEMNSSNTCDHIHISLGSVVSIREPTTGWEKFVPMSRVSMHRKGTGLKFSWNIKH